MVATIYIKNENPIIQPENTGFWGNQIAVENTYKNVSDKITQCKKRHGEGHNVMRSNLQYLPQYKIAVVRIGNN